MRNNLILATLLLATCLGSIQQVCDGFYYLGYDNETLWCYEDRVDRLEDDCRILKFFNQTEVDLMNPTQLVNTSRHCACQLLNMYELWEAYYNDDISTRRVATMVQTVVSNATNQLKPRPDYLWSDYDVIVYRVSIFTATEDYFEQQAHNKSMVMDPSMRRKLEKDEIWLLIRRVCRKVARDTFKLYRYMENLSRLNPDVFFKLLNYSEPIEVVYQASKACKLMLMPRLREYKIRPDSDQFIPVDTLTLQYPMDSDNSVSNDIDLMLKDASALLLRCGAWHPVRSSLQQLGRDCPMMMSDKVPTDWIIEHSSPLVRSQAAIKCGCQLLLHNSTWANMMRDPNVQLLSRSLTNYMNQNRVPDFSTTPIFAIYGWFEDIMKRFLTNRKMSIKEVVKTLSGDQDPYLPINRKTDDFANALELLRRACNFIMFNYKKGSKEAGELKLIRYLDNLQLISQDPMFVFHLTLQDPNLFKLHALSKMCQPVVH